MTFPPKGVSPADACTHEKEKLDKSFHQILFYVIFETNRYVIPSFDSLFLPGMTFLLLSLERANLTFLERVVFLPPPSSSFFSQKGRQKKRLRKKIQTANFPLSPSIHKHTHPRSRFHQSFGRRRGGGRRTRVSRYCLRAGEPPLLPPPPLLPLTKSKTPPPFWPAKVPY